MSGLPEETADAAGGVVVEPLPDRACAVLDDPHAAKVVRDLIDYVSIAEIKYKEKTGLTVIWGRKCQTKIQVVLCSFSALR